MIESAQQLTKSDLNHYVIVLSDLGWLVLFCVIWRTQICRSFLQRHLMLTVSLIINKKNKKRKEKNLKHFCKHLLGILVGFIKLRNLHKINWPRPDWLGLIWNLKLAIFQIKLAFGKKPHFAFIVAYFSLHIVCSIEWRYLSTPFFLTYGITKVRYPNTWACSMCSKCFLKIAATSNNYQIVYLNSSNFVTIPHINYWGQLTFW